MKILKKYWEEILEGSGRILNNFRNILKDIEKTKKKSLIFRRILEVLQKTWQKS